MYSIFTLDGRGEVLLKIAAPSRVSQLWTDSYLVDFNTGMVSEENTDGESYKLDIDFIFQHETTGVSKEELKGLELVESEGYEEYDEEGG